MRTANRARYLSPSLAVFLIAVDACFLLGGVIVSISQSVAACIRKMSRKIQYEERMQELRLEIDRNSVDDDYETRKKRYELETCGPSPSRCRVCNNLSPYGFHPDHFINEDKCLELDVHDWVAEDDCQFCSFLTRVFGHYVENSRSPIDFELKIRPGNTIFIADIRQTHPDAYPLYGGIDCIEVFKGIGLFFE